MYTDGVKIKELDEIIERVIQRNSRDLKEQIKKLEDKINGSNFITIPECERVRSMILTELKETTKKLEEDSKSLKQISISMYGKEEAGEIKGGVVNMLGDIKSSLEKSGSQGKWILERIAIPIILIIATACVTGVFR